MSSRLPGNIVTFYSYKGGVGRTMLLANVAWVLASAGKRVLTIDWDLEAPGLHRYFHPFLPDKELERTDGVIDLVMNYAQAAITPGRDDPDWHRSYTNVLQYAVSLDWHDFPRPGTLDFVPAGRQDSSYATRVSFFNWQTFYERLGGRGFIEAVKQNLADDYDYVLIDSRTGVSDTSGILTVQMPDRIVACFSYNHQSVEGTASVLQSVMRQREHSPPRIFPVATRVELAEKARLDKARMAAMMRMAPFSRSMSGDQFRKYWAEVETTYSPVYAYAEVLAPFADRAEDPRSILASAIRLTAYLTDGEVAGMSSIPEAERQAVLERFES